MSSLAAEKVVSAQATGTTAQSETVATVEAVSGKSIGSISKLRITIDITTALVGTDPLLNLFFQRPIISGFAAATGADWADFHASVQFLDSHAAGTRRYVDIPLPEPQDVDGSLANRDLTPAQEALAARLTISGHWGDAIRIRSVLGGTITTGAVYDVHIQELAG